LPIIDPQLKKVRGGLRKGEIQFKNNVDKRILDLSRRQQKDFKLCSYEALNSVIQNSEAFDMKIAQGTKRIAEPLLCVFADPQEVNYFFRNQESFRSPRGQFTHTFITHIPQLNA